MGLLDVIRGRIPGLSEEADRGRKEVLWIGAAIWVTPLFTVIGNLGSAIQSPEILVLAAFQAANLVIFAALAKGRSWARKLTLFFCVPTAIGSVALAIADPLTIPDMVIGGYVTTLVNAVVFTTASWTLWRSPAVRAYIESQRGGPFGFPTKSRRVQADLPAPLHVAVLGEDAADRRDRVPSRLRSGGER